MPPVSYKIGGAGLPPGLQRAIDDMAQRISQLEATRAGAPATSAVDALATAQTGGGITVSCRVLSPGSLAALAVLRGMTRDPNAAQVLHSWPAASLAAGQSASFLDQGPGDAGQTVNYWLRISGADGSVTHLGPSAQTIPGQVSAAFVSGFAAAQVPAGIALSFAVAEALGLAGIGIARSETDNQKAAVLIHSFAAPRQGDQDEFVDTGAVAAETAYYWLRLVPAAATANPVWVGPVSALMPATPAAAANELLDLSVSQSAGPSGSVTIGVAYDAPVGMPGCKVYAENYNGLAGDVAVAEASSSPFSFTLRETGASVTLKAVPVDGNGNEGPLANALSVALTLNGTATAPAKIMPVAAAALYDGIQIGFPAGPEAAITSYTVSRGPRGGGFSAAAVVGTVAPTAGAAAYTYTDTTGTAAHEWYVQAVLAAGTGAASAAAQLTEAALDFANRIGLNQGIHQSFNSPVAALTAITQVASSAAGADFTTLYKSALSFVGPGAIDFDVQLAGGIVDLILDCGNFDAYIFRIDGRAGNPLGGIFVDVAKGAWALAGQQLLPVNGAAVSGWHHFRCVLGSMGQMDLYVDGTHAATAQDQRFTPNGNLFLGSEVVANPTVAPFTGSTSLGLVNDVPGRQAFPTQTAVQRIRAASCGSSATNQTHGCWVNGNLTTLGAGGRSYNLAVIDRATMDVTFAETYDLYADSTQASNLANELSALDATKIVVIWTYEEPQTSRLLGGLPAALERCGASAVFSSAMFAARAAYLLIGIPGIGIGNGIELYSGANDPPDGDPNAYCETATLLTDGELHGAGGSLTAATTLSEIPPNAVTGASLSFRFNLPVSAVVQWYNLGTWHGDDGSTLRMELQFGAGYGSSEKQQALETVVVRQGNYGQGDSTTPNISGATCFAIGAAWMPVKIVANPALNPNGSGNDWDVYIELNSYANGHATVDCAIGESFSWNAAAAADPGANSATVVAATGALLADTDLNLNGSLAVTGTQLAAILLSAMSDRVSGALAQNGSGDPYAFLVGDPAGDHIQVDGPGQITVYNSAGVAVSAQVKRAVESEQFSLSAGRLANDQDVVYFNAADGSPSLLDAFGSPIPAFDAVPDVFLHVINPPAALGSLYASNLTAKSFQVNARSQAAAPTQTPVAMGAMTETSATASWSGTETDEISGATCQVSVGTTRAGQYIGGSFRPQYQGSMSFSVELGTGAPGAMTVLDTGGVQIDWKSDGGTYSGGCALGAAIPASTTTSLVAKWTQQSGSTTDVGAPSASGVIAHGGGQSSVNGVDFVVEAIEAYGNS